MKKLLGLALACALLLTGCGARGGDKGEELGDNTIRPLELTEEEAATGPVSTVCPPCCPCSTLAPAG